MQRSSHSPSKSKLDIIPACNRRIRDRSIQCEACTIFVGPCNFSVETPHIRKPNERTFPILIPDFRSINAPALMHVNSAQLITSPTSAQVIISSTRAEWWSNGTAQALSADVYNFI